MQLGVHVCADVGTMDVYVSWTRRVASAERPSEVTTPPPPPPSPLQHYYRHDASSFLLPHPSTPSNPRTRATMADAQVFEETFSITAVNNDKYDRVSRIFGTSTDSQITMTLDINHEVFPVATGESISLVLATTLALDGSAKGENDTMWRNVGRPGVATLADMYDYVCYGKNYRMEGGNGDTM